MITNTIEPLVQLKSVSKHFGAVRAIDGVDLEIFSSEVVALVGDNAAGKSTIARMLSGVYAPTAGEILFHGKQLDITTPKEAYEAGIAAVFQEMALCENLDVTSNIFLGRELRAATGILDESGMQSLAREYIARLGGKIPDVTCKIAELSAGQRQCVAMARSLVSRPTLAVLDEPTASMSVSQTADVLTHILGLRQMGLGILLISHNLSDVRAVADRIVVLRHGRINGIFEAANSSYEEVIAAITGASGVVN